MSTDKNDSAMTRTAFLYHPVFLEHDTGPQHPERRRRLEAVVERLQVLEMLDRCLRPEPGEASTESVARIHSPSYIEHIAAQSALGRHFHEDPDTVAAALLRVRDEVQVALHNG